LSPALPQAACVGEASDTLTVPSLLAARVARDPDSAAWWIEERGTWTSISWRDFDARIARLAGELRALGVERGQRVAIMARSSLGWEIADHAILRIGAVVVGIDPHAAPADRGAMLAHAGAVACFVDDAATVEELPAAQRRDLRHVLVLGSSATHMPSADRATPLPATAAIADPDDVATLVYTSGTTGAPKAIAFTHRQMRIALTATLTALGPFSAADRGVCWLPLASMFQRMMNLVSIAIGAQTWFLGNPRALMDELPRIRPTILIGVPRLFEKVERGVRQRVAEAKLPQRLIGRAVLAAATTEGGPPLLRGLADRLFLHRVRAAFGGAMRFMVSGSAPLSPDVIRFFDACGIPILEAYGLSECIVPVACNRLDARRLGSVGRPLPGNEIRLAEDGEVMLRSPGLFAGYAEPAHERARFDAEGFYATGDFGRIDAQGFLFLTGRKRDVFKTSSGRQVAPMRIEAGLRGIAGIEVAVVLPGARDEIVAVLGLEPESGATQAHAQAIRAGVAALNAGLARHEQIRGCVVKTGGLTMAAGHLTSSLKPRRAAIRTACGDALEALSRAIAEEPAELPLVFEP
jgi:long-chain acyl-CoA synthetase